MLGWNISVYRQADPSDAPATRDSPCGARLAVWQAGLYGLQWIEELVTQGKAISLSGNGYPKRYSTRADDVIPLILEGPPWEQRKWTTGLDSVTGPGWLGGTTIDRGAMEQCRLGEWLLIEAWDES
jgi:hypothetical protein